MSSQIFEQLLAVVDPPATLTPVASLQHYQESNPETQATGEPPRRPVPELSRAPPPVFAVEPSAPAFLLNPELGEDPLRPLFLFVALA